MVAPGHCPAHPSLPFPNRSQKIRRPIPENPRIGSRLQRCEVDHGNAMELERIGICHRHSRALTAHSRAEAFHPQFFVRAFVLISDIETLVSLNNADQEDVKTGEPLQCPEAGLWC
ncbi:unnamed protein product [Linum trigynum]|uniref:Uncharacterized protein n=1 Tax=Linum trigynum TaxID=586398 RepID=A0AAV2G8W0_9ROSI